MISGRSCRPRGGPESCVIIAHDALTGEELWRRRTVPAPGEPGDETWGGVPYEQRVHVGTWMPASYDPELRLIYQGTSVTSPAPKFMLGGVENTHLYHNSTLALDVDTGEIRWYYQHMNDHWDLDHPFERILLDTAVAPNPDAVSWINPNIRPGEVRKVMTGIPGKTGLVYTLDRETGEFLWATPTIAQNVISHIDGATGAVTENAEVIFTAEGQQVLACPNMHGGKDWEAGAYSPLTNTMYMPLRNMCQRLLATTSPDASHRIYALAVRHELAPGTEQLGTVYAISAETGETRWLHQQRAATLSLVATGGGLVFGGDANGRFRAFDQETGEVLWEINLGSPVLRLPDQLRRRRPPIHRGRHGAGRDHGELPAVDARVAPEQREQPFRVRPTELRSRESVPSARLGGKLSRRPHASGCRWGGATRLQTLLELQGQLEGVDPDALEDLVTEALERVFGGGDKIRPAPDPGCAARVAEDAPAAATSAGRDRREQTGRRAAGRGCACRRARSLLRVRRLRARRSRAAP